MNIGTILFALLIIVLAICLFKYIVGLAFIASICIWTLTGVNPFLQCIAVMGYLFGRRS